MNDTRKDSHSLSDRLDSWKAIAAYLGRSVRTVRRWEEREELPVHRHRHEKGSTVFAFKSELDAWRAGSLGHRQEAAEPPALRHPGSFWPVAGAALVLAVVVGLAVYVLDQPIEDPAQTTAAAELRWVLIADVEDFAGEPEHRASLARAVMRGVSLSTVAAVAPAMRVAEVRQRMRLVADAPLNGAGARELAMRDGHIAAVLIPCLERVGEAYVLTVLLRDISRDVTLTSASTLAESEHELLPALDSLVHAVRDTLDETLAGPVAGVESLEPVTTASLHALQLYDVAVGLLARGEASAALQLLEQAVEHDPEFPAAQMQLGWARRLTGAPVDAYREAADRAQQLAHDLGDVERYFVLGGALHLKGELAPADAAFGALRSLAPHHVDGNRAALRLCLDRHGEADCADFRRRLADTLRDDFATNFETAWALAVWDGDPHGARVYRDRAAALLQNGAVGGRSDRVARLRLFDAYASWLANDVAGALAAVEQVEAELDQYPQRTRDRLARELGKLALALGRLDAAESWFRRIADADLRHEAEALALFARGDEPGLRQHLAEGYVYREPISALLLSMNGLGTEAGYALEAMEASGMPRAPLQVVRARLAIEQGRGDDALELLRGAVAAGAPAAGALLGGIDMLAMQLAERGDLREAIHTLEMTSRLKSQAAFYGDGALWMMCQYQLARLYRQAGRTAAARAVEASLRAKLALADRDHPLLSALGQTQAGDTDTSFRG